MRTNGRPRVRKTLAKLRGRLHGSEGPRQARRMHSTEPARRIPRAPASIPSGDLGLWNSAYRTRISGFAACRNDDWSDAMPSKIEDYAFLGDCETSALVARDGSVDWLCWPRFDSGACFAALLGDLKTNIGASPPSAARITTRRYRVNTLILETDIETAEGEVTLIEFMPPRGKASDLVRIVVGKRGKLTMRTELIIRFDYGRSIPWVTRLRRFE